MNSVTTVAGRSSFSYRLIYFNVRGAAEICRLVLSVSGSDWTDVRYPMEIGERGFRYGPEFRRDAATGAFACNFDKLPVLQVINPAVNAQAAVLTLGQSHAIVRFVAQQHATLGGGNTDPVRQAKVDALYECCRDVQAAWYRAKRTKSKEQWFDPALSAGSGSSNESSPGSLQDYCGLLERALEAYAPTPTSKSSTSAASSPWCLGGLDPTLADVAMYHLLGTPISPISGATASFFDGATADAVQAAYQPYPRVTAVVQACAALPAIRDWEQRRPDTFT